MELEEKKILVAQGGDFSTLTEAEIPTYEENKSQLQEELVTAEQDLEDAFDKRDEVANSAVALVLGLIVVFGAVGGVLFMIWKRKREERSNFDFNEGGNKDDHFITFN